MRSRYTAFVLHQTEYLIKTWHPSCEAHAFRQQIEAGFADTHWLGLTVFEHAAGANDNEGYVSFVARDNRTFPILKGERPVVLYRRYASSVWP